MAPNLTRSVDEMVRRELIGVDGLKLVQTERGFLEDAVGGCAESGLPVVGHKREFHDRFIVCRARFDGWVVGVVITVL